MIVLQEEEKEKNKNSKLLTETLLAVLMLSGISCSLRDLYSSAWCLPAALVCGGLFLLTVQMAAFLGFSGTWVRRIWYLLGVGGFLAGLPFLMQGFLASLDQFLYLSNRRFDTEYVFFSVDSRAGLGSVLLWGLLSLVIAAFLLAQIQKKSMWGITLLTLITFGAGCIYGTGNQWLTAGLLLAGWFGYFHYDRGVWRKAGIRKTLLYVGILALASVLGAVAAGYGKSEQLERWKDRQVKNLEKFRYGSDTLPQGDLYQAWNLLDGEEERLQVEMETPTELYLRGFTGGSYENTSWEELSYLSYQDEYAGMLRWMKEHMLVPVTQYAMYERLTRESKGLEEKLQSVEVKNTGAYRKYVYLPAGVSAWDSRASKVNKDNNVLSNAFFGAKNYTFQMSADIQSAEKLVQADWLIQTENTEQQNYLDAESVYDTFVEKFYLTVEAEQADLINEIFYPSGTDEMSLQDLTAQIRKILRTQMQYSEMPDTLPYGDDMLNWFLKEKHAGNAVAYATAAVMAYRAAGYPARYVEGYHLSASDAANMQEAGENTAVLTTRNAHAWAEIYLTGIGWMPVEVVPGFYTESYTNETVEGKPAYRVNSSQQDEGVQTDQGGTQKGKEGGTQHKKTDGNLLQGQIVQLCILMAYLILAGYLLLELQRTIRLAVKKREQKELTGERAAEEIEHWMAVAGIKGERSHPEELREQVKQKFPGIQEEEYDRILELLQMAKFGGKEWKPYEQRVVRNYIDHLKNCLYQKSNRFGRILLRYIWLI